MEHALPCLFIKKFLKRFSTSKSTFRILQWNLLAKGLSNPNANLFDCEEGALEWKSRRALILEEMLLRKPDIIACQGILINKTKTALYTPNSYCIWCTRFHSPQAELAFLLLCSQINLLYSRKRM